MKPIYIHSGAAISVQDTFGSENSFNKNFCGENGKIKAEHPNYREYIAPGVIRRMSSSVKMGVACSKKALSEAGIDQPNAVIVGTGKGCIENSEVFLNNLLDNNEQFLTPTPFILSTHNTVGAQIALMLKCRGYNNTFSSLSASFESCLIDAQLFIEENKSTNVLVGGAEELGKEFIELVELMNNREDKPINVPYSEGAAFFVLSDKKSIDGIHLLDVRIFSKVKPDCISEKLIDFLNRNNLSCNDVDAIILGNNGDAYDTFYSNVTTQFNDGINVIKYKKYVGEFLSASSLAFWLSYNILKRQTIPKSLKSIQSGDKPIKNILIYNQHKGRNHSFVLLSK